MKKKSNNSVTVTGKKAGTATITATARATGSSVDVIAKCKVIVSKKAVVAPKSVKISSSSKKSSKTTYIGNSCTLKATVSPSNATNKNITWKSSNTAIATIDSKGRVNGKKPGTVTITATVTGTNIKSTYKIIVKEKNLEISPSSLNLAIGEVYRMKVVKVEPSTSRIVWWTSNSDYVTVDSNGNLRGIKEGSAIITATIYGEGIQRACTVNVR